MKSQNEKILNHLQIHGSITSLEAFQFYGITRLSGRVYDLREDGHDIVSEDEIGTNRDGRTIHYTRYKLNRDVIPTEQANLSLAS